jgi:hypothetical protein
MSTFVFFHVGSDLAMPTAMVASVKKHNPGAEIIQVTDRETPTVEGVTWAHPTTGDPAHLMLWRTQAFAALQLSQPALYMDTDMLVRKPIHPELLLGEAIIAVCRRSFMRDAIFNVHQRGQDYSEYAGKTLDQIYPYLGCATITPDAGVWVKLAERYAALPDKFKAWYGDQEVLRDYVHSLSPLFVRKLDEYRYACLPEHFAEFPSPVIAHYKGKRKAQMFTDAALA